jgi:hypothetical protein
VKTNNVSPPLFYFKTNLTLEQHIISLEAPDTVNECILRLVDTSVYADSMVIKCPKLEITVPGFIFPVLIEGVQSGFMYNLTACDLEIQTAGCGYSYNNLPDGIYILRYSVSPNDIVYAEYNHLRISKALNKILNKLCELDLARCEPSESVKKKMRELGDIRMYFLAAKAKVEVCHMPAEGMEIYKYAMKLLDKMNCKTCK